MRSLSVAERSYLAPFMWVLCVKRKLLVTTLLEVLDTAIKIGLGATITALATYWHSKIKYKADSAKEYEQRHRTLLEQVAEGVEELNHVYLKYAAYVLDWIKFRDRGVEWHSNRDEQFHEICSELFSAFRALNASSCSSAGHWGKSTSGRDPGFAGAPEYGC